MSDRPISNALWLSRVGWRLATVSVTVCVLSGLVILRCMQLVIEPPERIAQLAEGKTPREQREVRPRGSLYDRNRQLLAVSLPVRTLALDRRHFQNLPQDWAALQKVVGLDLMRAQQRYAAGKAGLVFLQRQLSYAQEVQLRQMALPGVVLVPETKRYYPAGEALAPVIGLADIDGKGQEGLEAAYNHLLAESAPLSATRRQRQSEDLQLTVDMNLQYQAYSRLKQAVLSNGAKGGSVTLVDITSGEILALASYPSYNPNNREALSIQRNRATMDRIEPGSLLKPFTVAAALQTEQWQADSVIDTAPGYLQLDSGEQFADLRNHGELTLAEILMKSSNVGTVRLGLSLQPGKHVSLLRRLGLGQATGIGLPAEAQGFLPQPDRMQAVEQATLSFGYGCAVTAVQLAQAYSVLGNGGVRVPLKLIRGASVPESERVMPAGVAAEIVSMLEGVVREGTGRRAAIDGYAVAGKTGTVHLTGSEGYEKSKYLALFAGLVPADEPRLALVITLDEPQQDFYFGSQVAAPLFALVARQALLQLGIAPKPKAARRNG